MPPIMRNSAANHRLGPLRGFTLLELLVVIAIIGILAGLMFPAVNGALRRAEKSHAENTAYNLKTAISAYFTEYRKFPVEAGANEESELRSNANLMDVLLGSDSEKDGGLNPRGIAFYTGKQAKPLGGGRYRKGITLEEDGGGELWDPWGEHYYVRLDLDYNNRVATPTWDNQVDASFLPETILVWSTGKEIEGDDTDNIKTW